MTKKERKKIAVVRIRGKIHLRKTIEDTLKMLNLNKVNHCVVIDSRREYLGMINKVNDYITWGEISPEIMEKLIQERGLLEGNKKINKEHIEKNTPFRSIKDFVKKFMVAEAELKEIGIKPVFRLNPPRKGYERKGIKKPYSKGGSLGYRGEKINQLLERMI